MRLVLASASPARLAVLRAAGLDPVVRVSDVDEPAVVARYGVSDPADVALLLARAKAEQVAGALTQPHESRAHEGRPHDGLADALVLGCDSVLKLDGEVHGKPADAEQARLRWKSMRGRSGVLHTGHWLVDLAVGGGSTGAAVATTVHFADLHDAEIDAYVATGEPLGVAGAFCIDGRGAAFVTGIEGDYHSVVGVSPALLRELVMGLGHSWPALWLTR
jgi:septum formation protein